MTKAKIKAARQGGGGDMMRFKTLDRIMLLNLLPQAGDYTTLGIVRQLQADLSFSEADHVALLLGPACETCGASKGQHKEMGVEADHPFKVMPNRLAWQTKADTGKDIKVGAKGRELIAEQLEALNAAKALTLEHMDLYERFCANGKVSDAV